QAEDGIRAFHVTGVQTCALPIYAQKTAAAPTAERIGYSPAMRARPVSPRLKLPAAPVVVVAGVRSAVVVSAEGEVRVAGHRAAAGVLEEQPCYLCHGAATARRLGIGPVRAFDLLELFAFVRPARFCLPTPRGLASALGLP